MITENVEYEFMGFDPEHEVKSFIAQVGPFVAEAAGKNPISALKRLENKIKHQLDSWKMNRFERA